jgi:hypothetical protein
MGRRWWQKEDRREQNEKLKALKAAAAEVVYDADQHNEVAQEVTAELSEIVTSISVSDVAEVELTAEQDAVEDAKDAEIPTPVTITQNKFVSNNNKKKRR